MNYSIQIPIYVQTKEDIELVDLEVTFDIESFISSRSQTGYCITGYFLDGKEVEFKDIKSLNMALETRVIHAIEHYITNYEEEYEQD